MESHDYNYCESVSNDFDSCYELKGKCKSAMAMTI